MNKIGFWPVFAIVTGSQIGTGIFMLPAVLAPFGYYSIIGLFIASIGAISLACVFASLCALYPKTGGPHAYVKEAFGDHLAFLTGWTYWIISWVSSTVVIIATISYLKPMMPGYKNEFYLLLEIMLVILITYINLRGVHAAGTVEFVLTLLKFIPLIIVPLLAMWQFDYSNCIISNDYASASPILLLSKVTVLALWCFIGLESATTTAGSVKNPQVTIPLAVIAGTLTLTIVYILNNLSIIGLIDAAQLRVSEVPYVDAAQKIFGGNWHMAVSLILAVVCIGTLNAWTLISGQIALGLAHENYFPSIFSKTNKNGAPYCGLIVAAIGMIIILLVTFNANIVDQLVNIIDISVITFLYVYLICSISYLVIYRKVKETSIMKLVFAIFSILFCLWVVFNNPLIENLVAILFILLGLPMYWWYRKRNKL